MARRSEYLSIGDTARRSGVAASALRFYETRGLISSVRSAGNQRRYRRSMLRRISVIRVAQTFGLTLEEIAEALKTLPAGRTPTKRDWERLSTNWRDHLDTRIASCAGCVRSSTDVSVVAACLCGAVRFTTPGITPQ